jgi:hypothetical protein
MPERHGLQPRPFNENQNPSLFPNFEVANYSKVGLSWQQVQTLEIYFSCRNAAKIDDNN